MNGFKTLPAVFYRTDAGREPVREWLKDLAPADRKIVGFIKTTRKTPDREIETAVRRMKGGA